MEYVMSLSGVYTSPPSKGLFEPPPFAKARALLRHDSSTDGSSKIPARRFSTSYLMEERGRSNHHVAELPCKVCHLHWSRAGVAHVLTDWNQQPVLLLATRLLADRDATSFQYEKGAAYDRQQIQMGLRKGNTVLIHYRRGSDLYQSVLINHAGC